MNRPDLTRAEIEAAGERYLQLVRDPRFRGLTFRQYLACPERYDEKGRTRLRLWGRGGGVYLPQAAALSYIN
jgi:hypothetical protein